MHMKAIFFDIDGVLNSNKFICNHPGQTIDPKNIENLAAIVKTTDAKLVLTCENREEYVKQNTDDSMVIEFNQKFAEAGLELYGVTPSKQEISGKYEDYGRNFEVSEYVKRNNVEKLVILDDMDIDWDRVGYEKFWINTENIVNGLTADDAKEAIGILNE
jgi:hypothetical protein